jgi:membrane protease YdiL (CAAX protease family)
MYAGFMNSVSGEAQDPVSASVVKHPWNTPLRNLLLLFLVLGLFASLTLTGDPSKTVGGSIVRSPLDVIASTVFLAIMMGSVVLFGVYACGQSMGELGLRFNRSLIDVAAGLLPAAVLAIGIMFITPYLDNVIGFNSDATSMILRSFRGCSNWSQALVVSGFIAFAAAVVEETFRVFVITRVENIEPGRTGTVLGILLSALAFSSMHGYNGPAMILVSLLAGLAFAGWYVYKRNVLTLMSLHFFYDFILLFEFTRHLPYGPAMTPGGGIYA